MPFSQERRLLDAYAAALVDHSNAITQYAELVLGGASEADIEAMHAKMDEARLKVENAQHALALKKAAGEGQAQ